MHLIDCHADLGLPETVSKRVLLATRVRVRFADGTVARKKPVCTSHAERNKITLSEYVRQALDHRDSGKG